MDGDKWSASNQWKDMEPGLAQKSGHAKENNLYIHARNPIIQPAANIVPTMQ